MSWPIRASIRSVRLGASSSRPVHRQIPYVRVSSPPSLRGDHQLAQQQRVARGQPAQPLAPSRRSTGAAEHRGEQVGGVVVGQRGELDVVDQVVGPQCADRQRDLARRCAACRATRGALGAGEQVDQRGGRRVEQVRVVDGEHDRPAGGLAGAARRRAQRSSPAAERPAGWSAGSTWARPPNGRPAVAMLARGRPDARTGPGQSCAALAQQPALADAGRAAEEDAPRPPVVGRRGDRRLSSPVRPTKLHGLIGAAYRAIIGPRRYRDRSEVE